MASSNGLPAALRTLFTPTAARLARETSAGQRERIRSGSRLAQMLVLGHLRTAKATLSQWQQTLASSGTASCSRQALAQHGGEPTARRLHALRLTAAGQRMSGDPVAMPLR